MIEDQPPLPPGRPGPDALERRFWHALASTALVAAYLAIARPFLIAATWAVILAVSAWPGFVRLRRRLGDRPRLAAVGFFIVGLVLLFVPLVLAGLSVARHAPMVMRTIEHIEQVGLPGPPDRIARMPLVGRRLHDLWSGISAQGSTVLSRYATHINASLRWLLRQAGSLGVTLLQFGLAIVMASLLLARSGTALTLLHALARRIGGREALDILPLAARTIRAVAFGVVGTSLVEAILSAAGFAIAGLPIAVLLGAATFLLCLLQAGPGLVFVPAATWIWWQGEPRRALFVLAWHLVLVLPVEMAGRPFFISRATGLPMLLVFVGVLGGLIAFGFIGIFVGSTILAVAYTMLRRWLAPGSVPIDRPHASGML